VQRTKEERRLYSQSRRDLTFAIMGRDKEESSRLTCYRAPLSRHRALTDELHP
jgi:hypothetical protein